MSMSKFEKQRFASLPECFTVPGKGRPQRDKIPRTTQVKRLYRGAGPSMKAWARKCDEPIIVAWLADK